MTLKDKVVVVTGGSKGIGRACAEAFAEHGAHVIINYAHDEQAAQETADALSGHGVKTMIVQADIANQAEVDAMFDKIKQAFPAIDVLVNNAGLFDENDGPDNAEAIEMSSKLTCLLKFVLPMLLVSSWLRVRSSSFPLFMASSAMADRMLLAIQPVKRRLIHT